MERVQLSRDHVEKLKVKYLKRILAGREESTEGKNVEPTPSQRRFTRDTAR